MIDYLLIMDTVVPAVLISLGALARFKIINRCDREAERIIAIAKCCKPGGTFDNTDPVTETEPSEPPKPLPTARIHVGSAERWTS